MWLKNFVQQMVSVLRMEKLFLTPYQLVVNDPKASPCVFICIFSPILSVSMQCLIKSFAIFQPDLVVAGANTRRFSFLERLSPLPQTFGFWLFSPCMMLSKIIYSVLKQTLLELGSLLFEWEGYLLYLHVFLQPYIEDIKLTFVFKLKC